MGRRLRGTRNRLCRIVCAAALAIASAGVVLTPSNTWAAPPPDPPAQAPAPSGPAPFPPPVAIGSPLIVAKCLVFVAKSVRDRQEDVENRDWVVLSVENHCPVPILALQAELLLVDTQGGTYGTAVWVVGRGERLNPGGVWEDTVPVPDPDRRVARAWTVRLLEVQTPPLRPPSVPPRAAKP